ncbi:MAG TPA: universal stress protein [Cyclobacteriaceae bacterium]|nr:universal stress protein [Cyclobacteriaceae bacterium]
MKILCPTDVSNEANNAVAYAAKLAQKTGSTLTLLNVQVLAELTPIEAVFGEEANVQNARNVLDQQAGEISRLFKIDCRSIVLSSLLSITSIIKNQAGHYDLIVMGTDGPDSFIETVRGSKTYRVASESDLPILVIPNDVGYSDVAKILFAFDYRSVERIPMRQVLSFARLTSADIVMLQIVEERWTHQIETGIKAVQTKITRSWPNEVPIQFATLYADDHVNSLSEHFNSLGVDMIAIGYHKQGLRDRIFHKSKTRQIVAGASYPLLIVHS